MLKLLFIYFFYHKLQLIIDTTWTNKHFFDSLPAF